MVQSWFTGLGLNCGFSGSSSLDTKGADLDRVLLWSSMQAIRHYAQPRRSDPISSPEEPRAVGTAIGAHFRDEEIESKRS